MSLIIPQLLLNAMIFVYHISNKETVIEPHKEKFYSIENSYWLKHLTFEQYEYNMR